MEGGEGEQVPDAHAAADDLKPALGEGEDERRDALPGAVTASSVGVELGNPQGEGHRKRSAPRKEEDPDSKQGKVFIGGLSWETNEDSLKDYFEKFGKLIDCVIMRDRQTGKPRGFGFVTFAEEADAKAAVQERHELDGREVEAKLAVPRSESNAANNAPRPTKKIFVGGLPHDIRSEDFKDFFTKYGAVEDAQVMIDHRTGNSRGFGFVTFQDEDATENVLGRGSNTTKIDINGKMVEVKRAESRNALSRRGDQQGSDQRGDRRGNSGGSANASQGQNSMSQGSMQGISPHLAAQEDHRVVTRLAMAPHNHPVQEQQICIRTSTTTPMEAFNPARMGRTRGEGMEEPAGTFKGRADQGDIPMVEVVGVPAEAEVREAGGRVRVETSDITLTEDRRHEQVRGKCLSFSSPAFDDVQSDEGTRICSWPGQKSAYLRNVPALSE
ncbi:hypothetical protein NDN08_002327 [Rhodosorus marinus]|uniref:RRM domain-containing protein n=1 Tax=Rhodosorus marinus TaxID=101924 RepID=A0AAV8UWY9_9RHOD|nr:hypothetical protein NDN08_002327 [Rhodosorus marinus]